MSTELNDDARARRERWARAFLAYVLVPAWVVPGALDWWFHRRTSIERNAGTRESLTHLAMAAQAGAGIVAGTLFEVDAGVIAAMLAAAVLHEATAAYDVAYARPRRHVAQAEQHVHSFLEVLPFVNAAVMAFGHGAQTRALAGAGDVKPRFAFRVRRPIPPLTMLVCGVSAVLGMGPYVEELVRCMRAVPEG